MIHQTPSLFHVHEHVQVAVNSLVAPGRRPEDAHVVGPVLKGEQQDRLSMRAEASVHGKGKVMSRDNCLCPSGPLARGRGRVGLSTGACGWNREDGG